MTRLRTGIITQARMTSTRLPGKIMIPIKDKPVLQYHVDRLAWSSLPIFIATTKNKTDDVVADFAMKSGLQFYRGSEDNVLSRYYECALIYKLEAIIRVTSDCPLIDGAMLREGAKIYREQNNKNLYYSNGLKRTFPRGFDFEIFSFELLENAYQHATKTADLEHVTPYINRNQSGNVKFGHFLNHENKSNIRLTLDTPEDLILIKKIIEDYDAEKLNGQQITGM